MVFIFAGYDARMDKSNASPDIALSDRVRSAVFWRSGSQIVSQIVTWTATLIVVRLLVPHDYGLFAMSQVVLVALNFLNGQSFASSLIRESDVSKDRIAQVFGLLILFNVVLATAQIIAAPYVAAYYRQPVIESMLHVQALIYAITPFIALPSVLLARELDFRAQAKADLTGAVAGAASALAGAWFGYGVWALVIAPIAMLATRAAGLALAARQMTWPRFDFTGMKGVMTFGSALVACQFFWVIQSQSDVAIAARHFDPHHVGLYSEALFLTLIVTAKFIPPLNEVAFPAYTALAKQGGDVGQAFLNAVRLTMLVAMPIYLGMSVVAEPLVETLFGEKWSEMATLVSSLSIAMPFFALHIICSPTTNALGKPGIYLRTSIAGAVIMPIGFLIGIRWGVWGLTHAWMIGTPLLLTFTLSQTLPELKLRWRDVFFAVLPPVSAALAMAGLVHFAGTELATVTSSARLAILVPLGALVYGGLLWAFSRDTLLDAKAFVTRKQLGGAKA